MWYLVCFSTSLSPSVNYVLYSTNTCHPTSLDPCETTKHSYQKGISSKPLPMTPIMTAIAQHRPVPWTGRRLVPSTGPDLTLNRSHLNRSHLNRSHLGGVHVPVGPVYGTNCLHKRLQKSLLYVSVGSGSLVLTPVNMKQGGFPKKGTFFARLPLQPMRMCSNGPPRRRCPGPPPLTCPRDR